MKKLIGWILIIIGASAIIVHLLFQIRDAVFANVEESEVLTMTDPVSVIMPYLLMFFCLIPGIILLISTKIQIKFKWIIYYIIYFFIAGFLSTPLTFLIPGETTMEAVGIIMDIIIISVYIILPLIFVSIKLHQFKVKQVQQGDNTASVVGFENNENKDMIKLSLIAGLFSFLLLLAFNIAGFIIGESVGYELAFLPILLILSGFLLGPLIAIRIVAKRKCQHYSSNDRRVFGFFSIVFCFVFLIIFYVLVYFSGYIFRAVF